MNESEEIYFGEEEPVGQDREPGRVWSEELKVSGAELVETVKRLASEAAVRRIVIRTRNDRVLMQIPMLVGVAGIALLPYYAALALIAALVTETKITVERQEKAPPAGA